MKDNIIYSVNGNNFSVDKNTGDLILNGDVIPHSVALELIEIIRHDLYEVREKKSNWYEKLFK